MYFYCPKCKIQNKEFKFKNMKEEKELTTWRNVRDGYGMAITHIKCPNCENPLSGVMQTRSNDEHEFEYYKNVISMYNYEEKDGGRILNGELENLKQRLKSK